MPIVVVVVCARACACVRVESHPTTNSASISPIGTERVLLSHYVKVVCLSASQHKCTILCFRK